MCVCPSVHPSVCFPSGLNLRLSRKRSQCPPRGEDAGRSEPRKLLEASERRLVEVCAIKMGDSSVLIGSSSSREGCCVILERAVLNRVLKADVFDVSVCAEVRGSQREWHVWVIFKCVVGFVEEHVS